MSVSPTTVESITGRSRGRVLRWAGWLGAVLAAWAGVAAGRAEVPPSSTNASSPALLQFTDGALLHGSLQEVDVNKGVLWQSPEARGPIQFRPNNLSVIEFENSQSPPEPFRPGCRFRFKNQDDVFGNLTLLDGEKLELVTAFGGRLTAPRQALQSVTFLPKDFSVLYEGPTSLNGWKMDNSPNNWRYRDGSFIINGVGVLGRDFKYTGSVSCEFDLAWGSHFSMMLIFCTSVIDRFDYSGSSYLFYLSRGYINAQRLQPATGAISLGQIQVPAMLVKNHVHLEFRGNKETGTLAVLADGVLIQQWKDPRGFAAQGSGIAFFAQMDGASLRVSNLRVAEWNGKFDVEEPPAVTGKEDLVCLANRDRASGDVQSLTDGAVHLATPDAKLAIPVQRVTQIVFGGAAPPASPASPWNIRALFNGGGSVSFQLEKWEALKLLGRSQNFGPTSFNPQWLRQVQFNLERSAGAGSKDATNSETGEFDE